MPILLLACGDGIAFLPYVEVGGQHIRAFPFCAILQNTHRVATATHLTSYITHHIALRTPHTARATHNAPHTTHHLTSLHRIASHCIASIFTSHNPLWPALAGLCFDTHASPRRSICSS